MLEYIIRLVILVPMVGALAWGSLFLWKRVQTGMPHMRPGHQAMRVTASLALGTGGKLNVIEFQGRELLIAVSRNGISLIATGLDGDFDV